MDKLPIIDQSTLKAVVDRAVSMVGSWTRHELINIVNNTKLNKHDPIIVPIGKNGYIVGNYAIKKIQNHYKMMYRYNDKELEFNSLSNAVNYSICQHRKQNQTANEILKLDTQIGNLLIEEQLYQNKIKRVKDMFKKDYYSNRLTQVRSNLNLAKHRLEKTTNQAKYRNHQD